MLILLSAAFAAPSPAQAPFDADALLAAIRDHLENGDGADGCLTGLLAELRQHADELTPEQRDWATRALTPWKSDLMAPMKPLHATPPPPGAIPTEPCFSMGQNRVTSAHFAVEWDDGTIDEDTANDFLGWLEDGYSVEVDQLGWKPILQGDRYLMLAYVERGDQMSAYTTVDYCGAGYVPYIVAYSGSFQSPSWAQTMAVHEFNHGLQFGYGFAWEFWWWEATATYIESQVYPTNDWWTEYVSGYTDNPQLAFNASDQNDEDIFWHMYGMALFGTYMDENLGGHDTILATWEAADGERGTYSFGMEDAFRSLGMDFDATYEDFIAKNAVMDYAEHGKLPDVYERELVRSLPAEDVVDGRERPEGYGQVYTRFDGDAGAGDLHVTFTGDEDVAWSVQLVEVTNSAVERVVAADVVDGAGDVTLEGFGGKDVVLVVSPLENGDSRHGYSWSAEIAEPTPEAAPPSDESAADSDSGADGAEISGGCGCDSGSSSAGAVAVGLALATLARRRR